MNHSTWHTSPTGAKLELGHIEHAGKTFSAGGSFIDHGAGYAIGYPHGSALHSWDGKPIGTLRITGHATGLHGCSLTCYRATIDDVTYYGRGSGDGMLLRLRKCRAAR